MSVAPTQRSSATAAVLFADVAGSSALYRQLGDAAANALIARGLEQVDERVASFQGRTIKTLGDGLLAVLPAADAALECAASLQRQFENPPREPGVALRWRIGFACGPVIERDADVFGDVVNLAARVADLAKAGQVLTHGSTLPLLSPALRAQTRVYDQIELKGIGTAETVLLVQWERRSQTELVILPAELREAAFELYLRFEDREQRFAAESLPISLGRGETCHWVIPNSFASRHHLTLEYRRGKFTLVDHSTNGTFVLPAERAGEAIYVRNEAFTLFGEGFFCLGARPEEAVPRLHYRVR